MEGELELNCSTRRPRWLESRVEPSCCPVCCLSPEANWCCCRWWWLPVACGSLWRCFVRLLLGRGKRKIYSLSETMRLAVEFFRKHVNSVVKLQRNCRPPAGVRRRNGPHREDSSHTKRKQAILLEEIFGTLVSRQTRETCYNKNSALTMFNWTLENKSISIWIYIVHKIIHISYYINDRQAVCPNCGPLYVTPCPSLCIKNKNEIIFLKKRRRRR